MMKASPKNIKNIKIYSVMIFWSCKLLKPLKIAIWVWTTFELNLLIMLRYFLFARRSCNEIFSIASAPPCAQFRHLSKRIGSNCCTVCNSINKETIWSAPRALLNHITLSYNFERNINTTKIYRILNLYLKMGSQFDPF